MSRLDASTPVPPHEGSLNSKERVTSPDVFAGDQRLSRMSAMTVPLPDDDDDCDALKTVPSPDPEQYRSQVAAGLNVDALKKDVLEDVKGAMPNGRVQANINVVPAASASSSSVILNDDTALDFVDDASHRSSVGFDTRNVEGSMVPFADFPPPVQQQPLTLLQHSQPAHPPMVVAQQPLPAYQPWAIPRRRSPVSRTTLAIAALGVSAVAALSAGTYAFVKSDAAPQDSLTVAAATSAQASAVLDAGAGKAAPAISASAKTPAVKALDSGLDAGKK